MASVKIVEMLSAEQNGVGTGEHVWIEVEFEDGRKLTIRADHEDLNDDTKSYVFLGRAEEGSDEYINTKSMTL